MTDRILTPGPTRIPVPEFPTKEERVELALLQAAATIFASIPDDWGSHEAATNSAVTSAVLILSEIRRRPGN